MQALAGSAPGRTTLTLRLGEAEVTEHHKLGVLLVEDQDDLRRLLARALKEAGFRVIEAASGELALAALQSAVHPVHLLVTDILMPGIDGCELATRVRSRRSDIKVLLMSGYAGVAVPPGIPFLQKPFSVQTLLREVRRLVDPLSAASSVDAA
jgi:two-component system cell cycle sensor histidine kinase/response regulator CckA